MSIGVSMTSDCEVPFVVRDEIKGFVKRRITALKKMEKGPIGPIAEEMVQEYEKVLDDIKKLNVCDRGEACKNDSGGKKKKRKVTKRNVWIGHCMRGEAKGGLAKGMKECSDMYKEEGEALLEKHKLEAPE